MADREDADKAEAVATAEAGVDEAAAKAEAEAWKSVEEQEKAVEKQVEADRKAAAKLDITPGEAKVISEATYDTGPGPIVPPAVPDPNREPLPGEPKIENPKSGGDKN